ncbi:unnamed protein product [Rhizophagus irregularis]|nr:unnamed protein product [Rhizophagus irregularis]
MNYLANIYYTGEGTEKNFERTFYWNHKAAENGYTEAMINLAIYYRNGEGTEKNLEKAFYWHQKVAESNKVISENKVESCNLCKHPYNDDQWCQKCINFVIYYRNGKGTEKNLENDFYWYQKLAESNKVNSENKVKFCNVCKHPYDDNQRCLKCNDFAICYLTGEGTEKDLEKAFYWHQKVLAESNKVNSENKVELLD